VTEIAIVGMACRYPDARNPTELWENVLAQRSAFRRIPAERLRGEDYLSADRAAADRTYAVEAAVIEGYEFDRVRFRIGGDSFRSADLTHWLALDVAAQALEDAGFPDGVGLPRATTGVLLGNTLTGEFSRANSLRLRWPYVRRVVGAALAEEGRPAAERAAFLGGLESAYKAPFPPVGEETLAGGLSNTIAGRICGHFDLRGGGYTVDGACASSLLAVASACSALVAGDLDVVLAGGVDLSIDPFEVVGFAKAGALASDRMQVYSQRSAGFWPGEGCGIVVLMRRDDAAAIGRRVHALVRGWGVSSDGAGAITRPAVDGQMLALDRAYRRAGWGIDTVTYFEGHGTGTEVGDATELSALSRARQVAGAAGRSAAIGSVKVLIGHTKAAAGVAGLIKAAAALERQVLPPTAGTDGRHPELMAPTATLAAPLEGQLWPAGAPLRAGVSAMGFGGVNAHVVLESAATERRPALDPTEQRLLRSAQDAELFLLAADHRDDLRRQVDRLRLLAGRLSRSELGDLSAALVRRLRDRRVRAGCVPRARAGSNRLHVPRPGVALLPRRRRARPPLRRRQITLRGSATAGR
jgi:enediyne polyketide synthase